MALRSAELAAVLEQLNPPRKPPPEKLIRLRSRRREPPAMDLLANIGNEPVSPPPRAVRPIRRR
jgi:hypothetical protein